MKITRGRIIGIAAVAISVIILCILVLLPDAKQAVQGEDIVSRGGFSPVYASVANSQGEYSLERNADGGVDIDGLAENVNAGLADSFFYDMLAVSGKGEVSADKSALEKFNLDKPRATVTLRDGAGAALTLYLGSKSPLGDGYYLTTDRAEDGVFLVDEYYALAMLRPIADYADLQLLDFTYESDFDKLARVAIYGKNRLALEFENVEGEFVMTQPVKHRGMQDELKVRLLTPLTHLRASERLTAAERANAGLSDPEYRIELDYGGERVTLNVGNELGENRYIGREGSEEVFLIPSAALDFLRTDYRALLGEYVYFRSIGEVDSLSVTDGGGATDIKITQRDRDTYEATVDGADVKGSAVVALYNKMIELPLLKKLSSDAAGEAEYTIKVGMKNGNVDILRLMRLNEREYAVEINGSAEFSTTAAAVDMIGEKLHALVKE